MTACWTPPATRGLVVALVIVLGGCINPASDRLAELTVMTTIPDGVEVVDRRSGTELGGWPNSSPMATVTYRTVDRDPAAVLQQLRRIALDDGWAIEPAGYLRGTLETDDGRVRLSAFSPMATDEVIVTVWL